MMKAAKRVAMVLAVLLVLFVGVSFLLPSEVNVNRALAVEAEPAQVHQLVGDLRRWEEWSPWEQMDETIRVTYGETTRGVGAQQSWTGKSGGGTLTVTASDPQAGLVYDMTFYDGSAWVGGLAYEAADGGTRVTWSMDGETHGIVGRWMGLLMDRMVGPAFEQGLRNLKTAAEALAETERPSPPAEETEPDETDAEAA